MVRATDLLIAPPNLPDQRFRDTVVLLLTTCPQQGSLGLVVNRSLNVTVSDLDLGNEFNRYLNFPIYWGGPVNRRSVWMLHTSEWGLDDTVELANDWSMTSSMEMFEALGEGHTPLEFRLFVGCSSWAPGQLELELAGQRPWNPSHSWLTASGVTPEWLFNLPVDQTWTTATTLSCHQAVDSWLT